MTEETIQIQAVEDVDPNPGVQAINEIRHGLYAIHDAATGDVLRYQTCPEHELQYNLREGESALKVDRIPHQGRYGVQGGCLVELSPLPDNRPYTARRRDEYPSIGDQLDSIWKAFGQMAPGALPGGAQEMLDRVRAVKEKYPKPTT